MKLSADLSIGAGYFVSRDTASYFSTRQVVVLAMLVLAVIGSSFSSIYVRYMNRQLVDQLDQLNASSITGQKEYSQLTLEQAALTNQGRIQRLAHRKLGMYVPEAKEVQTVKDN